MERQLSAANRRVTPEAVQRLGEMIAAKLPSNEPALRQGYARRFIDKVVVAPDLITIAGPVKALELAASGNPDQLAAPVPSLDPEWCRLQDSNL